MVSILQTGVIDVADWLDDELYPNYPEGARSKDAIFPPPRIPINFIKAQRRYLYKRSNRKYPDQFWGEIVAYLVGCLLDVQVPPAFAAVNSDKDDCGALIEWFYEDGKATYIAGGHFMQRLMPDFDRKRGDQHNFHSIQVLSKSFNRVFSLPNWEQWWCEALLFDALIGNTDRHQDNWGCIFIRRQGRPLSATMAPLFDNGTSLGHERFPNNLAGWKDENFQRYVTKGTHHVRWQKDDERRCGHLDTFAKLKIAFPEQIDNLTTKVDNFNIAALVLQLEHLCRLPLKVPLTQDRKNLYIKLLEVRKHRIREALT